MSSMAKEAPELLPILSTSKIVPILVQKLEADRIDCPRIHNICHGLCILARHEQSRDAIIDGGAILSLKRRCKRRIDDNDTTGRCATECLDEFKRHGLCDESRALDG